MGYIGQIAAAIAIIATQVYVARQLKQNTDAMVVNNANNYVDSYFRLNTPFATDRQFAELWVRGGPDFDSLDEVDKQRLIMWEFQAIAAYSNWFNLRQRRLVSDAQWSELESIFATFGHRQSVREAWRTFKQTYSPAFQRLMAPYIEADAVATGGQ